MLKLLLYITCLLITAKVFAEIPDEVIIESEFFNVEKGKDGTYYLHASGDVEVTNQDRVLYADSVDVKGSDNVDFKSMNAKGNVLFEDPQFTLESNELYISSLDNNYFSTKGISDLHFIDYNVKLRIEDAQGNKDFTKFKGINLSSNSIIESGSTIYLKSKEVSKSDTKYDMKKVRFSSCNINNPAIFSPWFVSAEHGSYNEETRKMNLQHMMIHFYGVPLVYLPKFTKNFNESMIQFYPPQFIFINEQTGVAPKVRFQTINSPLKTVFDIKPTIYTEFKPGDLIRDGFNAITGRKQDPEVPLTTDEQRIQLRENTLSLGLTNTFKDKLYSSTNFHFTRDFKFNDTANEVTDQKFNRYFFYHDSSYNADNYIAEAEYQSFSDRMFGIKYGLYWGNYLKDNVLIGGKVSDNTFAGASYQNYKPVALYIPSLDSSSDIYHSYLTYNKGNFSHNLDFHHLASEGQKHYNRLTQDVRYGFKPLSFGNGLLRPVVSSEIRLLNQGYTTDQQFGTDEEILRTTPMGKVEISNSVVGRSKNYTTIITPKVTGFYVSESGEDVPNLDSHSAMPNFHNIFRYSRYLGNDVIDRGFRGIASIATSTTFTSPSEVNDHVELNSFLGLMSSQKSIYQNLNNDVWIGHVGLSGKKITIQGDFVQGTQSNTANYSNYSASYSINDRFTFGADLTSIGKELILQESQKQDVENLRPYVTFQPFQSVTVNMSATNTLSPTAESDILSKQWTSYNFDITYDGGCSTFSIGVQRNNIIVENSGTPEFQFFFNYGLKGF